MQTLHDATTLLPECSGTTLLLLWGVEYNVLWCIQLIVRDFGAGSCQQQGNGILVSLGIGSRRDGIEQKEIQLYD